MLWNSLFTEFITEFGSTCAIVLKQLFAEGEGKNNEYYIHFAFGKYLTIFIYYYVILPY